MSRIGRALTVFIVPGTRGRTVSLQVPVFLIVTLFSLTVAGLAAGGIWLYHLLEDYQIAQAAVVERESLRQQVEHQERLIEAMEDKAQKIEQNLSRLRQLEEQVRRLLEGDGRSAADLPSELSLAPPGAQVAVGGPSDDGAGKAPAVQVGPAPEVDTSLTMGMPPLAPLSVPDYLLLRLSRQEHETRSRYTTLKTSAAVLGDHLEFLAHRPTGFPVPGEVTSAYGWRRSPFTGRRQWHAGVDIAGDYSDPVRATADGTVVHAGWLAGGYGYAVILDHGYGFRTLYAHHQSLLVEEGDEVTRGQVIALVGSSGDSTGPHVHYEVQLWGQDVDPMEYVK